MDLFFYREPEAPKTDEEEEAVAVADYVDYNAAAPFSADWGDAPLPEGIAAPEPILPVAGEVTSAPGNYILKTPRC